ncbi:hypothetical protein BD769DRAFT_1384774 [Suillus cothurnatus]|nr:hypothetical protein BD769DRAFT_1384774 [Suillus cothurnatus]
MCEKKERQRQEEEELTEALRETRKKHKLTSEVSDRELQQWEGTWTISCCGEFGQPNRNLGSARWSHYSTGKPGQCHPSSVDFVPVSSDHQHHDDANDGVNDDAPLAPQLDDIKIEYHPHSKIPSTVHPFSDFSCHHSTEDTMPRHTSPWEPFHTRLNFEVADIALAAVMTKDQTDRLFELMRHAASAKEDFTLQSHDEVRTLWKMASERFTPPWTANAFWDAQLQSCLPPNDKPLAFILYADKAKLSSFGTKKGYPIVVRIANLPVEIHNGMGVGGGLKKIQNIAKKKFFWHKSFLKLLEAVIVHSKSGYWFECWDHIQHLLWPLILILSADYEEHTQSLSVLNVARSTSTEKEKEKQLKAYSLCDVEVSHCDIHRALSFDHLHSNNAGMWGDHLWSELQFWLKDLGREAIVKIDANFDALPRWHDLKHFSQVVGVDFNDGLAHEDISKMIIFMAQNVLSCTNSELGYLLPHCIRCYVDLDVYAALEVHTEDTIAAGRDALSRFSMLMDLYIEKLQPETGKSWNFLRKHLLTHLFDDILVKGVTWNYNTKTNFRDVAPQTTKELKVSGLIRQQYPPERNLRALARQRLSANQRLFVAYHYLLAIMSYYEYHVNTIQLKFNSPSSPLSRTCLQSPSSSDSEDSDHSIQPVAPPSEGATLEHFQEYVKYLQLQKGKLEDCNAALNATNNILLSNQPQRSCKCSPSQVPSSAVSSASLATTAMTAGANSDQESEKFCTGMQRSVAGSIFNMAPEYFSASYDRMSNQQIMDMIGWVAGKGKDFDVLNAPIIYPDLKVNAKKVFGNWFMIAKFIKVAFFISQWAHPHVQAIVKNMNDYVFDNIDKTTHDADNTQAVGMEDFTDSLQWVMASLDDDDSDSDDNTAEAAPPATLVPPTAPPAPIITSVPPPAPIIASVPLPAPSISIPAAIQNNDSDSSCFGPISLAPQTVPTTVPNPVAVSAPRSRPAAIPVDVAAVAYVEEFWAVMNVMIYTRRAMTIMMNGALSYPMMTMNGALEHIDASKFGVDLHASLNHDLYYYSAQRC